jgi:hypothetical protein
VTDQNSERHHVAAPIGGESTSTMAHRRGDLIDRLAQGLLALGFEPTHLSAADPETGVVDVVLSTLGHMAKLLKLSDGWMVQAQHLLPGMVIDYTGHQYAGEPDRVEVLRAGPPDTDGMLRVYGVDGFVGQPVAADFRFEVISPERIALEETIVTWVGVDELSRRRSIQGANRPHRFG